MTNNKNNLPIHEEQQFIQKEQLNNDWQNRHQQELTQKDNEIIGFRD